MYKSFANSINSSSVQSLPFAASDHVMGEIVRSRENRRTTCGARGALRWRGRERRWRGRRAGGGRYSCECEWRPFLVFLRCFPSIAFGSPQSRELADPALGPLLPIRHDGPGPSLLDRIARSICSLSERSIPTRLLQSEQVTSASSSPPSETRRDCRDKHHRPVRSSCG